MKPTLFQLGPLPISSLGVFMILAMALGIVMLRRRAVPLGIDPTQMFDTTLYIIVGGFVLGRLGYVALNLPVFVQAPWLILAVWKDSGVVFYAALLGGTIVAVLFARRRQIPILRFADIFACPLAAGYAVAMLGALLHGLFMGRPTTLPWGVQMFYEQRHPTALYLLGASLGTYAVLRIQETRTTAAGTLFFLWLTLHALTRVAVEVFVVSVPIMGPLTLAQVVNILIAVGGFVGLVVTNRPQPEPVVVQQDAP